MKKLLPGLFALSLLFAVVSCKTSFEGVKYTVASQTANCTGVAPQQCLLVKTNSDTTWTFFYSNIEGFTYEPGYEYVLDVKQEKRENVPADASSIKYTLIKEVSKTQKTSENLPQMAVNKPTNNVVGKVVSVEKQTTGRGAAEGMFEVLVVKVEVTSSEVASVKAGDIIHCEVSSEPKVTPVVGGEYVFKAKDLHPAHALGVYMLNTEVMDLI